MSELITSWPAEEFGIKLVKYLRSRTMAGLPHIGVLGPEPDEEAIGNSPVDQDDTDALRQESIGEIEEDELDWSFVPNKLKYHLTIKPTSRNINETKVDFYIRLREGGDADVGKDLIKLGRPSQYILSEKDLDNVFKHFQIVIRSGKEPSQSECILFVDGIQREIPHTDIQINGGRIDIHLQTEGDPFMVYVSGKPKIIRQDYRILITKEIQETPDGHRIIEVQITNKSKKNTRSTLPKIKKGDTEEECREKIKAAAAKKKVDFESDPLWPLWQPNLYKVEDAGNNPEGNRYGYLMELFLSEKISSYEKPIGPKDMARITNCVFDTSELKQDGPIIEGEIIFRDHTTFPEKVPKMASGSSPIDTFKRLKMDERLASTLVEDMKYNTLYKFQEDALEQIIDTRNNNDKNTVLISARTAGGKTEAFLFPILDHCVNVQDEGVKAIIFYPTKALANDQASRFIKILYHLNKRLGGKKITLGLLHGDISTKSESSQESETTGLPFECPKCDIGLLRPINRENLLCDNDRCGEKLDFVWAHSRPQNYSRPPDILITNPDTIIWDLMLRPEHHGILGRAIFACMDCGMTYAPKGSKISCNARGGCGGKNLKRINPTPPSYLVFDEVHLFKGSFGINCSYFLSRIEKTIKQYAHSYHGISNHKITRIGSTATISNVEEFVVKFFNTDKKSYSIIPKDEQKISEYYEYGKSDKSFKRHHIFVMPYAYTSDSTVGMAIQYLEALAKFGKPPTRFESPGDKLDNYLQILTFVNSIKSSNSLIAQTRRTVAGELPDLQIDGHTTDFDRSQRSTVERKFNLRDLHVVFATSTLEVGVDFRSIQCVVINGFPYSFNDYLQRIGRGGRKNDSLIVTVCQNWKPVDHYYYAHGKNALEEQYHNIEPVPITRDNSEAMKKHVQGALLDYIIRNTDDSNYDLDDITTFRELENDRTKINDDVLDSCNVSPSLREDAIDHLGEFIHSIIELANSTIISGKSKALFANYLDTIEPRYSLTSLRSTDPEVTIEVFWNK